MSKQLSRISLRTCPPASLSRFLFLHSTHTFANSAVRTYPASAGTVMLPLTPANKYTATILFCGGQDITNWTPSAYLVNHPASTSCVSITPDVSTTWKHETSLPEGRTMGNMILLPNGKIFLVNGAELGTAGYGYDKFAHGHSYATNPLRTPV
jgi:hypothetical protein